MKMKTEGGGLKRHKQKRGKGADGEDGGKIGRWKNVYSGKCLREE